MSICLYICLYVCVTITMKKEVMNLREIGGLPRDWREESDYEEIM